MTPLHWPDPPLRDEVVRLDPLGPADVDELVAASIDAESRRWLPLPDPYTRDAAREYIAQAQRNLNAGSRLTMALRPHDGAGLLGTASLQLDGRMGEGAVGYGVAPWARGRGLAARATRLLAAYGFSHFGLHRVELLVQPGNTASRVAAQRTGAQYEGVRRNGIRFQLTGEIFDAAVFSLIPEDFHATSGT